MQDIQLAFGFGQFVQQILVIAVAFEFGLGPVDLQQLVTDVVALAKQGGGHLFVFHFGSCQGLASWG